MGNDIAEWLESLPSFKVHAAICTQLRDLVCRIMKIFPDIEAARPRCSSGIDALCSLNNALGWAKSILQRNANSSKLYLAITAGTVLSRCQRAKNLLGKTLSQIQNMVPMMLALEIYRIIEDLRAATYVLDPSEEEAGRVIREMIEKTASPSVSVKDYDIKDFQFAAETLKITSCKEIVAERRLLKRLLDETGDTDPNKAKCLKFLLHLLKKYNNKITITEREDKSCPQVEAASTVRKSSNSSVGVQAAKTESCSGQKQKSIEIDVLGRAIPPDDFRCPLSQRLMYDPVVIASGQTFERVWIQKWFDKGNDTCPKTKLKLDHLMLTPNTTLKDLMLKWCLKHGIAFEDLSSPLESSSLALSMASIASFSSSIYNLCLPMDSSSVSIAASDISSWFESSEPTIFEASTLVPADRNCSEPCHSDKNPDESDFEPLFTLAGLPWRLQRMVVEDARTRLKHINRVSQSMSAETLVQPLIEFLKNALDFQDSQALRAGSDLLLDLLTKNRRVAESLTEDAICLLSQLLDSEATKEALSIIEVLSGHPHGVSKIISSGALAATLKSILNIVDNQIKCLEEQALLTLRNMCSNTKLCSEMASLHCVPRLTRFLNNSVLSRHALFIFKHLCDFETATVSLTETNGCISSISELLESGTAEEQENAVCILLSLCTKRVEYSRLVMNEGMCLIPSLSYISINGNKKAKVRALELLRILRDVDYDNDEESVVPVLDAPAETVMVPIETKPSSKPKRFFGLKFPSLGLKKGRAC